MAVAAERLSGLQSELESIYGVKAPASVESFVIDRQRWGELSRSGAPEELVVVQNGDELEIGLYLEDGLLDRMDAAAWTTDRLQAHCTVVEGVSHFVYLTHRAVQPRPVSQLELELQAEVDKFATVLLRFWREGHRDVSAELRRRLFDAVRFRGSLSEPQRDCYTRANRLARLYCRFLEARYVLRNHIDGFLADLRRMYRMGAGEKLSYAACGAFP